MKSARLLRLQTLLKEQQIEFNKSVIGKVIPVLIENTGKTKGTAFGRSPYMQAVQVSLGDINAEDIIGKIINVKISDAGPFTIEGEIVQNVQEKLAV